MKIAGQRKKSEGGMAKIVFEAIESSLLLLEYMLIRPLQYITLLEVNDHNLVNPFSFHERRRRCMSHDTV